MGRLDHVHIRVPDRAEAAGGTPSTSGSNRSRVRLLGQGLRGRTTADLRRRGRTTLALFEASDGHPMVPQNTGVAFSVDAETFISFTRSLPGAIDSPPGDRSCRTT